jgi:hypothetical protein
MANRLVFRERRFLFFSYVCAVLPDIQVAFPKAT